MNKWKNKYRSLVLEMYDVGGEMGIYPAAVKGLSKEKDYDQRDGFKNGWNAAVIEYGSALDAAAERASEGMSDELQMLLGANLGSLRDGVLHLNMNDVWGWACAYSEEVPPEKLEEVSGLYKRWGWAGILYWTSEQNDGMQSEFKDNNRFIEFVRFEEELRTAEPSSDKRAYLDFNNTASPTKSMWKQVKKLASNVLN